MAVSSVEESDVVHIAGRHIEHGRMLTSCSHKSAQLPRVEKLPVWRSTKSQSIAKNRIVLDERVGLPKVRSSNDAMRNDECGANSCKVTS